jgi:hypothetical protein
MELAAWSWDSMWSALVAVGTLALAASAWWSVRKSGDLVAATERLAEQTKVVAEQADAEIQAGAMPLLMPPPQEKHGEPPIGAWLDQANAALMVRVRNVGLGPALNATASLPFANYSEWDKSQPLTMAPRDDAVLAIRPVRATDSEMMVIVTYDDIYGNDMQSTQITLREHFSHTEWVVASVEVT